VHIGKTQIHPLANFVLSLIAGPFEQFMNIFSNLRMQWSHFRRYDYPSIDQFIAVAVGRLEVLVLLERDGRDTERGRHAGIVAP